MMQIVCSQEKALVMYRVNQSMLQPEASQSIDLYFSLLLFFAFSSHFFKIYNLPLHYFLSRSFCSPFSWFTHSHLPLSCNHVIVPLLPLCKPVTSCPDPYHHIECHVADSGRESATSQHRPAGMIGAQH